MQTEWLIIDGNNLIHREAAERGGETGDFVSARRRLARRDLHAGLRTRRSGAKGATLGDFFPE